MAIWQIGRYDHAKPWRGDTVADCHGVTVETHGTLVLWHGDLLSDSHSDLTWRRLIFGTSDGELRFSLQAITNTTPTPDNLRRWGNSEIDSACSLCGQTCTLRHVLNACKVSLLQGRYLWRHNLILGCLQKYLLKMPRLELTFSESKFAACQSGTLSRVSRAFRIPDIDSRAKCVRSIKLSLIPNPNTPRKACFKRLKCCCRSLKSWLTSHFW